MATCKECLCYDVCKEHNRLMMTVNSSLLSVYHKNVEKSCLHFKSQDEYKKTIRGEWEYEVKSFYKDNFFEDNELCVYIVAKCSCCGEKYPNGNSGQVFSKTVYAPEGQEQSYKFDQDFEELKALEEYKKCQRKLKNYCPECGACVKGD